MSAMTRSRPKGTFGAVGADDRRQPNELVASDPLHQIAATQLTGVCFVCESPLHDGAKRKLSAYRSRINGARWPEEPEISNKLGRTGFLVAPDLVLTAGHHLGQEPLVLSAIFGLRQPDVIIENSQDGYRYVVQPDQVFGVAEICVSEFSPSHGDFALLRLDRPVPDGVGWPLLLGSSKGQLLGDPLVMMGHPRAQPLKIVVRPGKTAAGPVFWSHEGAYFTSTVDAFRHSSGSPILNDAGLVIGIQVGGSRDIGSNDQPHVEREGIPASTATRIDALATVLQGYGIKVQSTGSIG
jgi:V8-like Glu-specific endopeptidase